MAVEIEVKDLIGVSEPLCKLIDVVSKGIGAAYRPRAIRKEAEARAEEIKLIGEAQLALEVKRIEALTSTMHQISNHYNPEISERAGLRIFQREIQRQQNLESIADHAADNLAPSVSPEEPSPNWRTRFFNHAQDIEETEMQLLWGKILAGEVSQPGSYGLKTLDIMRNLTQQDAQLFEVARQMTFDDSRIHKINDKVELLDFGLGYDGILKLREAGLMHSNDQLIWRFTNNIARFGNILVSINHSTQNPIELPQIMFTEAGAELAKLIPRASNMEYFHKWLDDMRRKSYRVDITVL